MHVVLSLDVGGLERNVVNQARVCPQLGQDVSVLCIERPGELADRARSLGARLFCAHKRPGLRPGIIPRIRSILREVRPDVVHTHQIGPLLYTGIAARGLSIPLIVHTEHGRQNYAGRARTRWLGRLAARFASVFYCLSQDMADGVAAAHVAPTRKVRLIMNGIDTAYYAEPRDTSAVRHKLGIPADAPLIGTVGRLNEIKCQDVLLRAFARARRALATAHLLLVGDGPLGESLRGQARDLGLSDHAHFAGYQADPTACLQSMDVFALTSRSEGMPQALLEACVARIPVIASRVGGIPEFIDHGRTGLLFTPGDEVELAAGLVKLVSDRAAAQRMSLAAHEYVVARFDIARMARDYHRDFLAVLGQNDAARDSAVPIGEAASA
jgi:glycosyltransferase involved in cell wall biosynthesis